MAVFIFEEIPELCIFLLPLLRLNKPVVLLRVCWFRQWQWHLQRLFPV